MSTPTVDGELRTRLSFTEFAPEDLARIARYREPFRRRIPQMVTAFYDHLMAIPALRDVVNRFSTVERLKGTLAEYLDWLVRGRVDEEYMAYRLRVGTVHERIGLAPQWYLGMFHVLEHHIIAMVQEETASTIEQAAAIASFLKLLNLDMQLAMESYIAAYVADRADLDRMLALNQALTSSSQGLATTAEEFSASAETMTSAAERVAHRSAAVASLTREAKDHATAGAERLKEVLDTIRQVEEQMNAMQMKVAALSGFSAQMETILKAVENVAKQTNLLSLNAAIEAARAGQHGRGFAVVAEEVRRLSDRTAASLRQISELINASRSQVGAVSETSGAVGRAATGAAEAAVHAEGALQGIVQLTADSAAQVEEIDEAVRHLAAMAAQVQGGAEQNARLASTLSELAQKNN